jgi:hypothetical protein
MVVIGARGLVRDALASTEASALLAILVLLVPLEGINLVLQSLYAALGRVRAIFLRQYVIVPTLRLGVALALVSGGEGVPFLAIGWVLTSAVGVLFYGALAGRLLRARAGRPRARIEWPTRDIVGFALPVFLTNIFWIVLYRSPCSAADDGDRSDWRPTDASVAICTTASIAPLLPPVVRGAGVRSPVTRRSPPLRRCGVDICRRARLRLSIG